MLRSSFTKDMSTPRDEIWVLNTVEFDADNIWQKQLEKEISNAPRNKAVGSDEVFTECLNIDRKMTAKIISTFWSKCSKLKYVIRGCKTAILVPLYKRGDKSNPKSYHPIALLSHTRKAIETAIAGRIKHSITLTNTNWAFGKNRYGNSDHASYP